MMGTLGILNVGAGDTKLIFDPNDPEGTAKAAAIVKDMIRRGYALLIEVGKADDGEAIYRRAKDFDERTHEYIIAGPPAEKEEVHVQSSVGKPAAAARRQGGRTKGETRVKASGAEGFAVARIAGG